MLLIKLNPLAVQLFNRVKRYVALLFVIIISSACADAQGVNNLWLYGYNNAGVNGTIDCFGGSPVVSLNHHPMYFYLSEACISDNNGNLLFYSNGQYIADASDDTMMNGSGLNPGLFADTWWLGFPMGQSNIIIPFPDSHDKYYLFHETGTALSSSTQSLELFYSVIDMSLNNGLGAVTIKNQIVVTDTLVLGEVTAVKHANGRDWWIICHKHASNKFFMTLVTPDSIHYPISQDIGGINTYGGNGQNVFSPNGKKYARYLPHDGLDILDFDRCSGNFSIPVHIVISDSASYGGVAFSPNSRFLYVGSGLFVYQYDTDATDIELSKITVAVWDSFYSPQPPFAVIFFKCLLAPDGKIYIISSNGSDYLHVINNPDSLGLACDLQQHSLYLQTYNSGTMPNYPNYFLGSEQGSFCDSLIHSGIETNENSKSVFSIYPNPSYNQKITITYPSLHRNSTLLIYNIDGKLVSSYILSQWSSYKEILLPRLPPGIYVARINELMINVKFLVE